MSIQFPVANTLTAAERRMIGAMRRFLFSDSEPLGHVDDHPLTTRIEMPMKAFLDFLWSDDPFAVDVNHPADPEPTTFELQLLYAIAECRAQNHETVLQLLKWWFPDPAIENAKHFLRSIARAVDRAGVAPQSSERLRAHLLAISSQRVKHERTATENSKLSSKIDYTESVH